MISRLLAPFLVFTGVASGVELFSFQAGPANARWPLGTIAVGNIDNDPEPEVVFPVSDAGWRIEAYDLNGVMKTGFPYHTGTGSGGNLVANLSPTLFDVDGDGRLEILFAAGNHIIALNGENGGVLWDRALDYNTYVPNSGYQSTVGGFYWQNDGAWHTTLPTTSRFYHEVSSLMVADIEGDGDKEIITAWKIDPDTLTANQDYNKLINDIFGFGEWGTVGEAWSGGVVLLDAATGNQEYVYHIHQLVEAGISVGQADADTPLEIYALNDADSIVAFDKTQPHGFHGKGTLHKKFGKNQRLISGTYGIGVDVHTTDIDGDGLVEVLVPTRETDPLWEPHETILDDDGAVMWRHWKDALSLAHDSSWGWMNSACMIPINPDHDNRIDVVTFANSTKIYFREWDGRQLVDRPGWPIDFAPLFPTPPVVGDVDGDGQEELIIGTYHPTNPNGSGSLRIYSLNGALEQNLSFPAGIKHIPSLVDVDSDGDLDVVFRSAAGVLYAYNFGAGDPGAVSWGSHDAGASRDRNYQKDLFPSGTPRIPVKQGKHERAYFEWQLRPGYVADAFKIYRSTQGTGPFECYRTLPGTATSYTDYYLTNGQAYFYEVAAVYGANQVHSPTFVVVPQLNNNRLFNGGFETDDDDRWDKWYNDYLTYAQMRGVTTPTHSGQNAFGVGFANNPGVTGTLRQANQYGVPDPTIFTTPGRLYSFGGYFKNAGFDFPTRHWFEWESNKTGLDSNNRPLRPYPNYFTPPLIMDGLATDWIYANRVFQLPNGFPNVDVRHRVEVPSGDYVTGDVYMDDLFFRELPASNDPAWQSWINYGSTWRYFSGPPAPNWFTPAYSDAAWPQAAAKFGAGATQNIVTNLPQYRPTHQFRRTFTPPTGNIDELLLLAKCTDNQNDVAYPLRVWINGQPIVSSGIELGTGFGNEERIFDLTPFIGMFNKGAANLIAVEVNNTWYQDPDLSDGDSSWDVVAFDLSLRAMPYAIPGYAGWAGSAFANYPGGPSHLAAQPEGNPDGDQANNLMERAVNSSPTAGGPDHLPFHRVVTWQGQDYPAITYRRWVGGATLSATRYRFNDMLYVVEVNDSLDGNTWVDGAGELVATGNVETHGDGTETVELRFTTPIASMISRKFARLRIVLE